jgi:hypothetical protein
MAVCVASGKPWLGFPTKQSNVIIIDEESGPIGLKRRLLKVGMGEDISSDLPIKCFSFQKVNFVTPKKRNDFKNIIKKHHAGLVLVDALIDVIPGVDENSAEEMNPILKALAEICKETNCAIVIIHHTNKTGDFRGSMVIKSSCDIMVNVKAQGKTKILFDFMKARDIEGHPFSAEACFEDEKFWLSVAQTISSINSFSQTVSPVNSLSQTQQAVFDFLREHGASSTKIITTKVNVASEGAVRKAKNELVKKGIVHRTNSGAKGKQAIYDLFVS